MTAVFACACTKAFASKAAASSLKRLTGAGRVEILKDLCTPEGQAAVVGTIRESGIDRVVLAGCPVIVRAGLAAAVAEAACLPAPHVATALVPAGIHAAGAAPAIGRALAALEALPGFEIRRVKLAKNVLVVGAGPAGLEAARALAKLGHAVTVIDRSAVVPDVDGIEVIAQTKVTAFEGFPGSFTVRLSGPTGIAERSFGAVVVATGVELADPAGAPFVPGRIIPLPGLSAHLAGLRIRELPKALAIVLDFEIDEGKASCQAAYRAAVEALKTYRANVTLLVRDAKVAALDLNRAHDDAREAGVAVLKYMGTPVIRSEDGGVAITVRDSVTGAEVRLACGIVAVSPWGLRSPADVKLAAVLGLDLDALGRFQDNSSRLLPAATNRRGVFAVGACRGETWLPAVLRDARAAALAVHALLAPRAAVVDTAHAVVDGDKCVLCLTCVRTCPFKAMGIHAADRRADCRAELCRQCGICAGECPNRAITLPAWSDPVVMALAGAGAEGAGAAGAGAGAARAGVKA